MLNTISGYFRRIWFAKSTGPIACAARVLFKARDIGFGKTFPDSGETFVAAGAAWVFCPFAVQEMMVFAPLRWNCGKNIKSILVVIAKGAHRK